MKKAPYNKKIDKTPARFYWAGVLYPWVITYWKYRYKRKILAGISSLQIEK